MSVWMMEEKAFQGISLILLCTVIAWNILMDVFLISCASFTSRKEIVVSSLVSV
jgi:hypothetical protein